MKSTTPNFNAASHATVDKGPTGIMKRSLSITFLLAALIGHSAMLQAQTQFADDYVPQPAYAAQTRAPLANKSTSNKDNTGVGLVKAVVAGIHARWQDAGD